MEMYKPSKGQWSERYEKKRKKEIMNCSDMDTL